MSASARLVPVRAGRPSLYFDKPAEAVLGVFRAGLPTFQQFWRPSVEYTSYGHQLCFEAYGGRWFRSSEEKVRDAVDLFCMDLANGNYICWNDLYANFCIEQTHFGAQWGYSPDLDSGWGLSSVHFDITLMTDGELVEKMGESVLIIEPRYDCYPIENYLEY